MLRLTDSDMHSASYTADQMDSAHARPKEQRAHKNREAQRAFRERRERYIQQLENNIEESPHIMAKLSALRTQRTELESALAVLAEERHRDTETFHQISRELEASWNELYQVQSQLGCLEEIEQSFFHRLFASEQPTDSDAMSA